MKRWLHLFGLGSGLGIFLLLFSGCNEPRAKVLASGWADPSFEKEYYPMGELKQPITYVFSQGVFYPGDANDQEMESVPFTTICDNLRPYLTTQGYVLVQDPLEADMAIVVNWGITYVDEEDIFWSDEEGMEDESVATQRRESELRNARILGVRDLSLKLTPFRDDEKLRRLATENYFFVLLGFDMEDIKNKNWDENPIKWVTKFSLPINKGSFEEVLPALAKAGAQHVGRKTDDGFTRLPIQLDTAEMGELEEVEER